MREYSDAEQYGENTLPSPRRYVLRDTDGCLTGIVSAPLWDSKTSTFAGLLTSTDFINVIQYYLQFPEKFEDVEKFRLSSLRGMCGHDARHSW